MKMNSDKLKILRKICCERERIIPGKHVLWSRLLGDLLKRLVM